MALVVSGILAGLFHHLVYVQDLPTFCPVAGLNAGPHPLKAAREMGVDSVLASLIALMCASSRPTRSAVRFNP
jgi:hypothetical protein